MATAMPMPHFLLLILLAAALLLSAAPLAVADEEEVDDEHAFTYTPGAKNGPERWGGLNKNWTACSCGRLQSPIDLADGIAAVMPSLGRLHRSYRPARAALHNRGHDISLKWEGDAGALLINGTLYKLLQLHWHSPSEHTVNGHRFALEMHMVHESAAKHIAVVAALYDIGEPDHFLEMMAPYIHMLGDEAEASEEVGIVHPRSLKLGGVKYYRYMGSLTTPPCTEGVTWTVLKKLHTVSMEQVNLLKDAVHDKMKDNARPTQPANNRIVGLYKPEYKS